MKKGLILSLVFLMHIACNKTPVEGLWLVQKVNVNDQEITPEARWMQFNADGTQRSGNGWKQHSIGTYSLKNEKLTVTNSNGYKDDYDPFVVRLSADTMYWMRNEDGNEVMVTLIPLKKLPTSGADQMLGVWKLSSVVEEDIDVTDQYDPESKRYIYFRWDQLFIERNTPEGTLNGVYQCNGHQNEVQLIFNHDCTRTHWEYAVSDTLLVLSAMHTPMKITKTYRRIHYFP